MVGVCQPEKRVKRHFGQREHMREKQKSKLRDHLEFIWRSLDFHRQHQVGSTTCIKPCFAFYILENLMVSISTVDIIIEIGKYD